MFTSDDTMLALGSGIAGLGLLMVGLLALLFRHPAAPRWTRPEIVALLACVPVTAMIGVGLGYAGYGVLRLLNGTGEPRQLLVPAVVLVVLALAWHGLGIRRRLRDYAGASGGSTRNAELAPEPRLAIDERPGPRPGPGTPSGRRAAA